MRIHEIKLRTEYFYNVLNGDKTFEIRYNDRNYQKGDKVLLKEFHPTIYKSREISAVIGDVVSFKQKEDWVVFSLKDVKEVD